MMGGHYTIYFAALCCLLAGASIAPPPEIYMSTLGKGQVEICTSLADKLPCDQAGGSWAHICKASVSVSCTTVSQAVEVSRKMPEHVYGFIHSVSTSDEAQGDVAVHGAEWMVGTSLGLGLMVMGRLLYTPCLFCLPAVLVGYAAIQPLVPSLSTQMGVGEGYIYLGGACAGLVLALLQRHVFVWLLGVLIGVMSFITLLIGTTLLSELPSQALLAVGAMFAVMGSSVVWHVERTRTWKVVACALVGSILFTDAVGVSRVSGLFQVYVCTALTCSSVWWQLCSAPAKKTLNHRQTPKRESAEEGVGGALWVLVRAFFRLLFNVGGVVWRAAMGDGKLKRD